MRLTAWLHDQFLLDAVLRMSRQRTAGDGKALQVGTSVTGLT